MRTTVMVLFGPIVWATHLLVVYGAHAVYCAIAGRSAQIDGRPVSLLLAAATAIALLLVVMPLCWPRRFVGFLAGVAPVEEARFLLSLVRWLAGLSFIAVTANGLAMLIVPLCQTLS